MIAPVRSRQSGCSCTRSCREARVGRPSKMAARQGLPTRADAEYRSSSGPQILSCCTTGWTATIARMDVELLPALAPGVRPPQRIELEDLLIRRWQPEYLTPRFEANRGRAQTARRRWNPLPGSLARGIGAPELRPTGEGCDPDRLGTTHTRSHRRRRRTDPVVTVRSTSKWQPSLPSTDSRASHDGVGCSIKNGVQASRTLPTQTRCGQSHVCDSGSKRRPAGQSVT
ncbi:hypothetical protein APR09_001729 [Nocardia amikacinitolerans]|nr:hypothetical protein [Nocardia amikacinitolerans]